MTEHARKIEKVRDVLDQLGSLADRHPRISIGAIAESFGKRSFAPFIFLPALIEISPIGGIPGVPTLLALLIVIVSAQLLFGRSHVTLPAFLERLSVSDANVHAARDKLDNVARWMDRMFHRRFSVLTRRPMARLAALLAILLAVTVPPLELLPFASTAPMAGIAAIGLALLVRDGLMMGVALLGGGGMLGLALMLIVQQMGA